MRLLLIADDDQMASFLAEGLREKCFIVDVARAGRIGYEKATTKTYDVIVVDWELSDFDGISVCRELRAQGVPIPILMLTSRESLEDRVAGLNAGADDCCLAKLSAFSEVLARIRALLRRPDLTRPTVLTVGDLTLDPRSQRVTRNQRTVMLTPIEYLILEVLMRHAGEVVTRQAIAESVWPIDRKQLLNTLEVHISCVRRKIEVRGAPRLIHTIWGRGYRMEALEQ
jgi:DNA-binding response OmpR family regulator